MRKIYIIGTLHGGCTPENELEEILTNLKPDQLMVEIQQKDIDGKNFNDYPNEMVFGYKWAKDQNIPVYGIDTDISDIAEGKTDEDNQKVMDMQIKIINQHNWKDFNKKGYVKLLDVPGELELVDKEKADLREREMLENILENVISKGTVVVLTGAGHLAFFGKELPEAIFPLS